MGPTPEDKNWYIQRRREFNAAIRAYRRELINRRNENKRLRQVYINNTTLSQAYQCNIDKWKLLIRICDWLLAEPSYITISYDDASVVSFCEPTKKKDKYAHERRQKMSFRRFLQRRCPVEGIDEYNSAEVENEIFSRLPAGQIRFNIFSGDDVRLVYLHKIGGKSCMSELKSEYTRFYTENSDVVKILVGTINGNPTIDSLKESASTCRCLLWFTKDNEDKESIFIDRIYNSGKLVERGWLKIQTEAVEYLKAKFPKLQIIERKHNTFIHDKNGLPHDTLGKVSVKIASNKKWPYFDSFAYATGENSKELLIHNHRIRGYKYVLQSPDGVGPLDCKQCHNIDSLLLDYCSKCLHQYAFQCKRCRNYRENSQKIIVRIFDYEVPIDIEYGTCCKAHIFKCHDCELNVHISYKKTVEGRLYCKPCAPTPKLKPVEPSPCNAYTSGWDVTATTGSIYRWQQVEEAFRLIQNNNNWEHYVAPRLYEEEQ